MQKSIILVLSAALFCVVLAAPPSAEVKILRESSDQEPDGSYVFGYEADNGNARDEVGKVNNPGSDDAFVSVHGSYKYTDPADGQNYEVTYTADEHGFVPVGKHIPEAISKAAQAAVEFARANPEPKGKH